MTIEPNRTEVSVKLLQSGRYTWTITYNTDQKDKVGISDFLRSIDQELRIKFPNHVDPTVANTYSFSEEAE